MDETPVPAWQKALAVLYVIVAVGLVAAFRSHLHDDFIPVDGSRVAPNILASFLIVIVMTPIGVLLWPPARRRLHAFMDRKLAPLHAKVEALHARHDEHADALRVIAQRVEDLHVKADESVQVPKRR